jgi:PAS domain S-box-containing protein
MTVGHLTEENSRTERQHSGSSWMRNRFSVVIALAGIVLTFVCWRVLRTAEQVHVNRLTSQAANAIAADLASDVQDRSNALRQMANVWAMEAPESGTNWKAFATMFIQHHPGCIAVEYTDSSYGVREATAVDNGPTELGRNLALDPSLRDTLDIALTRRDLTLSPAIFSPNGRAVRMMVVPAFLGEEFRGVVVAKLDAVEDMEEMLRDVSGLGYSVQVVENGRELYTRAGADRKQFAEWGQTSELHLPGLSWTIRVWPSSELLTQLRTRLPELALLLPLAFTCLLLIMLRFVQTTSKHAREMEATNAKLGTALRMRQIVEDELRESRARFEGVLEISPDAIISTDEERRITLFNQGAEAIFGYRSEEVIGKSLELLLPDRFRAAHYLHVGEFSEGNQHVRKMMGPRTVLGLRKDGSEFPLEASISKLELKGEKIYTSILRDVTQRQRAEEELRRAHDELEVRVEERTMELQCTNQELEKEITERKEGEEMLRHLSGRLLQAQDEERRRVARELHDSTAQYLAALALNIAFVQKNSHDLPENLLEILSDAGRLVDRCTTEIRTMSYLLHPPLLDDLGLISALQWYSGGFTKRSGVKVLLELSPNLGRLPADHERAYFRIVQECLTNVRKHSGATVAKIRLAQAEDELHLEISDNGCGLPGAITQTTGDMMALLGVGIAGMRERMRQLGGRLEMRSTSEGSVVTAVLPIPREVSTSGASTEG